MPRILTSTTTTAIALIVATLGAAPAASAVPQLDAPRIDRPLSPVSQQNAINKAQDYLSMMAFSRTGLINQLEYEGFSASDATYAVDSLDVDWNRQAAKKAKDYLGMMSFSAKGLADQLAYEGFTPSQVAYGVSVAYR